MKNRKIVVVGFLLVATLLLGVGYAALTDTLTITGTMSADNSVEQNEFEQDIYFSAAEVAVQPASGSAEAHVKANNDEAEFGIVGLTTEGHFVTYVFTITNDSDKFGASVTPGVASLTNENDEHEADEIFGVTWTWADENGEKPAQDITGAAEVEMGGTKKIYVTVELITPPTEAHSASYTLTLNAEEIAE
jgi:hypothetical protein